MTRDAPSVQYATTTTSGRIPRVINQQPAPARSITPTRSLVHVSIDIIAFIHTCWNGTKSVRQLHGNSDRPIFRLHLSPHCCCLGQSLSQICRRAHSCVHQSLPLLPCHSHSHVSTPKPMIPAIMIPPLSLTVVAPNANSLSSFGTRSPISANVLT